VPCGLGADKPHSLIHISLTNEMKQLSSETKHAILIEYQPRTTTHSFTALAARHSISGGRKTISKWYQQWDGSAASLEHKKGAGRPRALSAIEVSRYIRAPVLGANRSHRAIHYPEVQQTIREKTGKQLALRTVQQYGEKELQIKDKHSKKRTAQESE